MNRKVLLACQKFQIRNLLIQNVPFKMLPYRSIYKLTGDISIVVLLSISLSGYTLLSASQRAANNFDAK
jgi:hypothetical protein